MTKNNADKIISPVKVSLAIIYGLTFLIIIIVSNFYSQKQVNKNITDFNKNYDLENQLNVGTSFYFTIKKGLIN